MPFSNIKKTNETNLSSSEYTKGRIIRIARVFSIVAALALFVFIIDDIINKTDIRDFIIDSIIFIFLVSFSFAIHYLKKHTVWLTLVLILLLGLIIRLAYAAVPAQGGNFIWFVIVPMASFLLLGKTMGLLPSVGTGIILILLFFFPDIIHFDIELANRFKFHIILGFTSVTFISWFYELNRERLDKSLQSSLETINRQKDELHKANNNLQILIKETNHRINNNLMMISALIDLYSDSDDPKDQILTELNDKIISIAKSNYMLYTTGNGAEINMNVYLAELINQLKQTFAAKSPNIERNIADINMNPDYAVRIGLITNELITNACKYGISKGGSIYISLIKEEKKIILTISNDGREFPDSIDIATTNTMGFSIIRNLLDYLKGTINISKKEVTLFQMHIPLHRGR